MELTVTVAPSRNCLTRSVPLAMADATAGAEVALAMIPVVVTAPVVPAAAAAPAWMKAWMTAAGPVTEMRVDPTRIRATPPAKKMTFWVRFCFVVVLVARAVEIIVWEYEKGRNERRMRG